MGPKPSKNALPKPFHPRKTRVHPRKARVHPRTAKVHHRKCKPYQFSVQFSYQISAARGAGTLEIPWFRQPMEITMVAAARGAGSRVFSNPVRKTIPKPSKTGLEREASPPKSK